MTANTPESRMQSAFVLRGTSLRAGIIYWRRESRKGKRELEVPPKPVCLKRIYLDILQKAILALIWMNCVLLM